MLQEFEAVRNSLEQNTNVADAVAIWRLTGTPCKDMQAKHAMDVSEGKAEKGKRGAWERVLVIWVCSND
jgi:hypothetical protein